MPNPMKMFQVGEDEKCGCCNWKVDKVFLMGETQEDADEAYKENDRGLCGACIVEMLTESEYTITAKPQK